MRIAECELCLFVTLIEQTPGGLGAVDREFAAWLRARIDADPVGRLRAAEALVELLPSSQQWLREKGDALATLSRLEEALRRAQELLI